MDAIKPIIKNNSTLTSFKFYTEFLEEVAGAYKAGSKSITFMMFENGDSKIYESHYRLDPLVLPLLLSLIEQLSKFHKKEIPVLLYNNLATNPVLEFLFKSDFFYISGHNRNPTYPIGRRIAEFDEDFLGSFSNHQLRNEHRVRSYSLDDDGLRRTIELYNTEETKRDFLMSHYTYKVQEHFHELLFDNENTIHLHNVYIDILSELVTNAVLHSKSNAFALMFVDRFSTKFSISDNGVGFQESLSLKQQQFYFTTKNIYNQFKGRINLDHIAKPVLDTLLSIFETLLYSSLKDRHGIFDLMVNVVLMSKGYFRIHCENCQLVISNRMADELKMLKKIRDQIYLVHNKYYLTEISEESWNTQYLTLLNRMQLAFMEFFLNTIYRFTNDVKYSSIRFYKVKFRGVHIEVEIPNTQSDGDI